MLGGTVTIDNISVSLFNNFPYLSFELHNISITDSLFAKHKHRLFSAEKVFARINPAKLLLTKISLNGIEIDNGGFYLFTDSSGYSNGYLLTKKRNTTGATDKSTKNALDKIELKNVSVTIQDLQKNKLFDFLIHKLEVKTKTSDSAVNLQVKQSVLVKSLAFNRSNGSYATGHLLEGNYGLQFLPGKQALAFENVAMTISKQPFRFSGSFIFGKMQLFDLRVSSDKLLVDFARTLLTQKIAKAIGIVTVQKPLDVSATISGSLAGGEPLVLANWVTKNNSIKTPFLDFDSCSFAGGYSNEVVKGLAKKDPNSKVELHQFTGKWRGLAMSSNNILINNLTIPEVTCDLTSVFSLPQLNDILQSDALSLKSGKGSLRLLYKGPIDHISPQNAMLAGALTMNNGTILITGPNSTLTNCSASFHFANTDIIVDSLMCRIAGNPIKMWGRASNVFSLLGDSKTKVSLRWNAFAPVINMDNFSSMLSRKVSGKPKSASKGSNGLASTARQLDELLSNGNIAVKLRADKLIYHHFTANSLSADLLIDASSWKLQNASLVHGKGNIRLTAAVSEQNNRTFQLTTDMHMQNVDASKIWYGFDDFGFKAFGHRNIAGVLTANANASVALNRSGNFDMRTLSGNADFSVRNGSLIHFAPVEKIQLFLFKDRNLSNIAFAEIKDKIRFNRGDITIDRMEINSSVLSLFVEGTYSMFGKTTDISIQVPLSNLKKRDTDYKPENLGAGRKGGMSVFLRATSAEDGTVKLKYDPFKKFRKSGKE